MRQSIHNHIFSLLICIVLFFIVCSSIYGQDIKFEHLNRDNGLPVNTVTCATQDKNGYIWMGSMYGLVKFDGINYKLFEFEHNNPKALPGYLVTEIISADNGLLYLAVRNDGLSILNPVDETFTTFKPQIDNNFDSYNINAIAKDSAGNLWLGTDNGLYYFNIETQIFARHLISNRPIPANTEYNPNEYISALAFDVNNKLYLLGHESKLIYFDTKTYEFEYISYTKTTLESLPLFSSGALFIDENQKVWIGTECNGVFVYDPQKRKSTNHYLRKSIITSIKKVDDHIWIGTDGDGLTLVHENEEFANTFTNTPNTPYSIGSNAIYCIFESCDHTIWVGSYAAGVNLYNASLHKFTSISELESQGNKLSNKSVLCLHQVKDKELLIGTDGGGINVVNLETQKVSFLESGNNILDKIVAKSICKDEGNSFYVGTYGEGLLHCTYSNSGSVNSKKIIRKNKEKYKNIWSIHKNADTAIWLGYLNSGLSIYNPVKNSFSNLPYFDGLDIILIKKIANEIWISAEQKGIFVCNNKGEIIRKYAHEVENEHSLSSDHILAIFEDSKKQIWLGNNNGGLNLIIDKEKAIFKRYNSENGLPANLINNIQEDENGNLWLGTNSGLIKFNPNSLKAGIFDNKDGLQGKIFNYNASFNDENLYFGGADGLSHFHPATIKHNIVPPQVTFTKLHINNKEIKAGEKSNGMVIFHKPFGYVNDITLSHKDKDFTIEFSALHFESVTKNQYRYKLEGFDSQWITCKSGQASARYTNLSKGSFIFKVLAGNPDNAWSKKPRELGIKIMPPFYNTVAFYIFIILLILTLIAIIVERRITNLNKAKKKLEDLVDFRTLELQEKAQLVVEQNEEITCINNQLQEYNKTRNQVFSIIAHDLRSPLGAIISFSNILNTQNIQVTEDEKKRYLAIIGKTGVKMNDLITNLLYWVNNKEGKLKPKPESISIKELFSEIEELTKANALEKEISLAFTDNNSTVYADREMLVTIFRNLVSNSIKFTARMGNLSVNASSKADKTTVTISDSGVGMSKEQIQVLESRETLLSTKGTDNESGTGLGLFLCKDFTEKNNGKFIIDSKVGIGTTIKLIFPSNQAKKSYNCI